MAEYDTDPGGPGQQVHQEHRVHVRDLPGHGSRRGEPFTIAGAVAAVADAIDELGGRALLVGLSLGGLPVARWGYRLTPAGEGTRVTEDWVDQRRHGWRRRVAETLGLLFTGTPPARRAVRNRAAMRVTLLRLAAGLRAAS
ncbi:alpha/beta fold hydrolase [Streptomyces sioyaensis]|uniref:alpha/beta fold hydrolase n=1 Tax=Streptomyces sioyaensis TaxID=67364 RepID=UPI0037A3DD24